MYVYLIRAFTNPPLIKIGSSNNPKKRLCILQVGSPVALELIHTWKFPSAEEARLSEEWLHKLFQKHWCRGEWFHLTTEELRIVMQTAPNLSSPPPFTN